MWKLACPDQGKDPYHAYYCENLFWKPNIQKQIIPPILTNLLCSTLTITHSLFPDVFQRSVDLFQPVSSLTFIDWFFFPYDLSKVRIINFCWQKFKFSDDKSHIIINFHCTKPQSQWRWSEQLGVFSPFRLCVLIRLDHTLWNLYFISGLICSMKIMCEARNRRKGVHFMQMNSGSVRD